MRAGMDVWRRRSGTAVVAVAMAALLIWVSAASAAAPAPLSRTPEDGQPGEGAGHFKAVEGIAADPNLPGHVYVVDQENARIDEFTAWGQFVKAWGWNVIEDAVGQGLQSCTTTSKCQAGSKGGGAGQLNVPQGIAVDGAGNVYVIELANHRVQKFDPDGGPGGEAKFLLTFGYKVNKTHEGGSEAEANLCTAASGDECQAGAAGTGAGRIGGEDYRNVLAASSVDNAVFVGEEESIQRFSLGGVFQGPGEVIAMPTGKLVELLAAGPDGSLYLRFAFEGLVKKLKPQGGSAQFLTPSFAPEDPSERAKAVAVDGHGNLYVIERAFGPEPTRVQKYDAAGTCLTCGTSGEGGKSGFDRSSESQLKTITAGSACEADDAYVLHFKSSPEEDFFRAFGEHPNPTLAGCEPPPAPPSIDDQFAATVETSEASVKGKINPHFWSGSVGTTTYRVQYATQACFESEGEWAPSCIKETPAVVLGGGAVGEDVSVTVRLEGLTPGTAYRYRFAAEGTGEAGEVLGVGGKPGTPGEDAGFITFRTPGSEECAANEAFRTGLSATLPDCRAYEMVSPVDKEGGDIVSLQEFQIFMPAVLSQSATSGDRLAYGSARSFGVAESAPLTTQYIAARHPGEAWLTHPISPPRGKNVFEGVVAQADTEFRLFSADLCSAWLQSYAELPVPTAAPAGVADIFRRTDNECGGPAYEPLNIVTPPVATRGQFGIEPMGISEGDGSAIFIAKDELATGGSPAVINGQGENVGPWQLYGSRGGEERFLCILPGGAPWTAQCSAGGGGKGGEGRSREANVTGALSADGSKVYWTNAKGNSGKIYLRENPFGAFGPGGEECSGEEPCTLDVSKVAEEAASTISSQFWAAAKDGSVAIFTTGGRLYEYRAGDSSTHLIAGEVLGLMGQSEDASRIYLASKEALTLAGEENENEEHAVAGKANLYLHEGGSFRFIGALGAGDLSNLSPIALEPLAHTARVGADGNSAAFMSVAPLSGYDNTDALSGKADAEVFLYNAAANAGAGKLVCASCNPSGARPRGTLAAEGVLTNSIQAAAKIPVPQNMFYPGRLLAENGRRLFFESYDPLTPRDTNGKKDVYQWEAPEEGKCLTTSPTYSPANGGCVDLISSGQSLFEASFLDASPAGGDVFFTTLSSLLPQDPGLVDVYDARAGGGLPIPPILPPGCEAEACQHPAAAPGVTTPSSEAYEGPEDNPEAKKPAKCAKGKHRVNGKCVKKKQQKKKAKTRRGARR